MLRSADVDDGFLLSVKKEKPRLIETAKSLCQAGATALPETDLCGSAPVALMPEAPDRLGRSPAASVSLH